MPLAYRPPGVSVDEIVTPQISSLLAAPALVCLVGPSQGYQTRTDQFVISGTSAIPLPGLPSGAVLYDATVSVKNALNPSAGATDGSGYTVTTDFTISTVNGTITRVGAGTIPDNTLVNVTYRYVVADYYQPIRLYDLASVESRFGSALNAAGTGINSYLSYAAAIAFENGAPSIVCQPLFARTVAGDPTSVPLAVSSSNWATSTTWSDTLYILRDVEDINIIVPVIGQSMTNVTDSVQLSVEQAIEDHIYFMRTTQQQYVIGLYGEDSSTDTTKATKTILQSHATTLRGRYGGILAEQQVLVNTSRFTRALPAFGGSLTVGGQYLAAGIAGMLASRPTASTLTRKVISGFLTVADPRDLAEKNADAAAGLMVVEQKGQNLFVRHAVTIDTTASAKRELSVVRAKHRVIESVRDTIDRQLIGNLVADANATNVVRGTIIAVLEGLKNEKDIVDYTGVQARFVSLDPTTIQVRFSYRPAFPVNYINVEFSLDLSTGQIQSTVPEATI